MSMKDVMVVLSKTLPERHLLEKIEEALKEYKLTNSKEAKDELHFNATLWLIKASTEGENIIEVMKKMEQNDKANELFSIHKDKLS